MITEDNGTTDRTSYRWIGERLEVDFPTSTGELTTVMWED